jgi:hypothetical protein
MNRGDGFDVTTFVTHPWVAVVEGTGDLCTFAEGATACPVLLPT